MIRFRMICALAALAATPALSQEYPARPVRMVVPLTPASGADIAGRIVGRQLQDMWKQTVVVDNRPGAGGQIGTQIVVRAAPDGHTLARPVLVARRQSGDLQESAVRLAQRSRGRRLAGIDRVRHGHGTGRTVPHSQQSDRRRPRETRGDSVRFGRSRHLDAYHRRISGAGGGNQAQPHSVQGLGGGNRGCHRRQGRVLHGAR